MFLYVSPLIYCLLLLGSPVFGTIVAENATYDDLKATQLLDSPIGTYKYLNYSAWVVAGQLTPGVSVGSVIRESQPNVALTAVDVQTEAGRTPSFAVVKPYKAFGLLDFYFGCVLRTDENTVDEAVQCTITVAGFQANNDKETAIASYTFTPPVSPIAGVPMEHAVLPNTFHQSIVNVTVIQNPATVALLVDNIHYNLST